MFSLANTPAGLSLALARGSHSISESELLSAIVPSSGDNDVVDSSVSLNSIDSWVEVDVAGVSGCGRSGKLEVVCLCDGHCMLGVL